MRESSCKDCVLHEQTSYVCLVGAGAYPADLMLVGEAPGEEEERTGLPFQGRAGKMLDSFLETFKIDRRKTFISNAVRCRPTDNDTPDWKAIQACRRFLLKEISYVKPKLIIALGGVAAKALLNRRSAVVGELRSIRHRTPEGVEFIVTYHPAGILRNNYFMEPAVQDWEWALRILAGEEEVKEVQQKYRYIENPWDIIKPKKVMAIDLETTGLDPWEEGAEIKYLQICQSEGYAYMMPWTRKVQRWFDEKVAQDTEIEKVGHNLKFDMKWLWKYGVKIKGPIFDTLIAGHLLDENQPDKSLDAMASQHTPVKSHKDRMKAWLKEDKTRRLVDAPKEILVDYGCGDTDATFRLRNKFRGMLQADSRAPFAAQTTLWKLFQFQMDVLRGPALEMEFVGIKINRALIPELRKLYQGKVKKAQKELHRRLDITGAEYGGTINANSHVQLKKVWYGQWDLPAFGKPKKWGRPPTKDTAEVTVIKLIHWLKLNQPHRWKSKVRSLELVLEIRGNRKLLSTYVKGIDEAAHHRDMVHPSFKLHGTVTGRWSSSDINMQNIPRKGEIKKLFISRYGKEGRIFKCDLSQAELRWAAWIAREFSMIKDFHSHRDIHKQVAHKAFGIPFDQVTDDDRKRAKIVNFGILYQSGAAKQAEGMGCSVQEAQKFIDSWFKMYPRFRQDLAFVKEMIIKYGCTRTWTGRIRRVPVLQPYGREFNKAVREGYNSRIQGGVSDFLVYGMLQLYKEIKKRKIKARFVANVHDEIVLDTVQGHVQELSDLCVGIFTKRDLVHEYDHTQRLCVYPDAIRVPMEIETAAGPNWLEVETIHGAKEVKKASN